MMNKVGKYNFAYWGVESNKWAMLPVRCFVAGSYLLYQNPWLNNSFGRMISANLEMFERLTRPYPKPEFGIPSIMVEDKKILIEEEFVLKKPFCNLLHFKKMNFKQNLPKVLIVAPLAGHHATLLRDTVESSLPYFDVYITDWIDASLVSLKEGTFNLDDYIDYIIEFTLLLGSDLHVMAVCQPTITVLAAISIISETNPKAAPKSMILMGGPIDARSNPTKINKFASSHNMDWFKNNVITTVPPTKEGFMRQVYPGYLQLSGFLLLNLQKHIKSHIEMYENIANDNEEVADKQKRFYDEYLAVMDLPAEYYLETIKEVFHDYSLAKGELVSRGRKIDLTKITNTSLLAIEGENDDITGIGQTKASLDLCKNIPVKKKQYHLQEGVGHYGVFSGSKFRKSIFPVIKKFVYENNM